MKKKKQFYKREDANIWINKMMEALEVSTVKIEKTIIQVPSIRAGKTLTFDGFVAEVEFE